MVEPPRSRIGTVVGNSASETMGIGVHGSTMTMKNSIVRGNGMTNLRDYTGGVTVTYSDVENGWSGTGNIDADPLFVDPANGDYRLAAGSPCINTRRSIDV